MTETTPETLAEIIKARRKRIRQDAPCEGCGSTLAACEAQRGKDPTAPPWFGCCARGSDMAPCSHRSDPAALSALLNEVEAGRVRTVAEVDAERERKAERHRRAATGLGPVALANLFRQGKMWRTKEGEWLHIAEMERSHRVNTARFLMRRAEWYAKAVGFAKLMVCAPDEVMDSWLAEDEVRMADPRAWLRSTALYRAMVDGLALADGEDERPVAR